MYAKQLACRSYPTRGKVVPWLLNITHMACVQPGSSLPLLFLSRGLPWGSCPC